MCADMAGLIGPNAIIQVRLALERLEGAAAAERVLEHAGLRKYLAAMPDSMVREGEVADLQHAVVELLGAERARSLNLAAGRLTASYLLAHRIPRLVQTLLRLLPSDLASRMLSSAIARHAWTFAGSGKFNARAGRPTTYEISGCPLCRRQPSSVPVCHLYAGTFEGLFARLVDPAVRVRETECQSQGAAACRFELSW